MQAALITPPFTLTAREMGNTLIDMAVLNIRLSILHSSREKVLSELKLKPCKWRLRLLPKRFTSTKRRRNRRSRFCANIFRPQIARRWKKIYKEVAMKTTPEKPYASMPGMQTIIDELAQQNPKAKGMKAEDSVDMSFVKNLDDQGFFKQLYNK